MLANYTDKGEGYKLEAFSSLYVDYGLRITKVNQAGEELEEVYTNPCCLSVDCYGVDWYDEEGEELEEGIPWTPERWKQCLKDESWEFLEAFLPVEQEPTRDDFPY